MLTSGRVQGGDAQLAVHQDDAVAEALRQRLQPQPLRLAQGLHPLHSQGGLIGRGVEEAVLLGREGAGAPRPHPQEAHHATPHDEWGIGDALQAPAKGLGQLRLRGQADEAEGGFGAATVPIACQAGEGLQGSLAQCLGQPLGQLRRSENGGDVLVAPADHRGSGIEAQGRAQRGEHLPQDLLPAQGVAEALGQLVQEGGGGGSLGQPTLQLSLPLLKATA